jgi:hypothetical protein
VLSFDEFKSAMAISASAGVMTLRVLTTRPASSQVFERVLTVWVGVRGGVR